MLKWVLNRSVANGKQKTRIIRSIGGSIFWKKAAEAAGLTMLWLRLWLFTLRFIAPVLMVLVLLYTSGVIRF